MAVRIRLQRHGKKGKPFYWIVAADSRSKRDGKYLEKLGTYNPNVNPPIVSLDVDATVKWIQFGAQPSDTARNIISKEGALLKNHLFNGVKKGAISQEDADKKFELARTNVFELASFVDSQLRVMSRLYSWSDEEMEYLKNWVYKEKDPFLAVSYTHLTLPTKRIV